MFSSLYSEQEKEGKVVRKFDPLLALKMKNRQVFLILVTHLLQRRNIKLLASQDEQEKFLVSNE